MHQFIQKLDFLCPFQSSIRNDDNAIYVNELLFFFAEGYFAPSLEDEIVPWSDTPQVGRFGPISRRGTSITRPSKPSQTLAAMDDETNPTAVVRHSKQMSKQLPPTASLILQVK